MPSTFNNPLITGVATQSVAATQATHLIRYGEVIDLLAAAGLGYSNVVSVAEGAAGGTVTGLGLSFTPTKVFLAVQCPAAALSLNAVAVGAPTADGFVWQFANGVPDATGYKVTYLLLP